MTLKKIVLIATLIGILGVVFASVKAKPEYDRMDCIVQPRQTVLNYYSGDRLKRSVAINDDTITQWRKGQTEPHKKHFTTKFKDRMANYHEDTVPVRFSIDGDMLLFGDIISKACFEAL